MKRVIVTIPAYNEGSSIGRILDGIHEVMSKESYEYCIQVVDDGSTDSTPAILDELKGLITKYCGAEVESYVIDKNSADHSVTL